MPPLLWTAVILVGTSWPSISVGPDVIIGFDKLVHFSMYAGLALLVMRALGTPSSMGPALAVLAVLMAFGAADEWHQGFIVGRSASRYDWIADSLGALTGILLARVLLKTTAGPRAVDHRSSLP